MVELIAPHGGVELRTPLLQGEACEAAQARAASLRTVPMASREVSDLIMLGIGAYTPLAGFMGEAAWRGTCTDMKLPDGTFWPIPITLSCEEELGESIAIGEEVALVDPAGEPMASLTVEGKYRIDADLECRSVFLTTDEAHPGVAKVRAQGPINLAGPVQVFSESVYPSQYPELYLRPTASRARFAELGWSTIAAFQTRNPMHRSHEYLVKVAAEICDGVFIHQVLGALKPGDIPADVRTEAIDALVQNYFVAGTCIQAGYPIEMRYAGPREALLHGVIRQNFGCSHLIVGRDHAGVGSYYGPFDAHKIFDSLESGSLLLQPLKLDLTFYCHRCAGMASTRTCPHDGDARLNISGTRLREMFANHEAVPAEYSRPEVLAILQAHYDRLDSAA